MINYSLYIDMMKQEIIIKKSPDAIKHRIPFYIDQLAGIITQETTQEYRDNYIKTHSSDDKKTILDLIYSDVDYLYLLLLMYIAQHPIEINATDKTLEGKLRKEIDSAIRGLMKYNKCIDRSKKAELFTKLFETIKFTVKKKGDKCDRGSKGFGWDGQDLFISEKD